MDFSAWLRQELQVRGWNRSDLARQMNLSAETVGTMLTGKAEAGPDFCIALAQALCLPREVVFQARGWLLPPVTPSAVTEVPRDLKYLVDRVQRLPRADREGAIWLWSRVLTLAETGFEQIVREAMGPGEAGERH